MTIERCLDDMEFFCYCARAHMQDGKLDYVAEQLKRMEIVLAMALAEAERER